MRCKMKFNRYLVIFSIVLLSFSMVQAQTPATNEQFILNAVENSASNLFDSLGVKNASIYVVDKTGLPGLVVDGFKAALLKRGARFIDSNDESFSDYIKLDISLSAFEFAYKNGKSRGFFRKPYIKRNVIGQVQVNIEGGGITYLQFRDFGETDEVDPAFTNYIGSVRYNQLSPDPPGRGVMKYVEPLAVTATVGGLIYLFFINR
jgi:hypothetical protein